MNPEPTPARHGVRHRLVPGSLLGLVAAACGLGIAELVASVSHTFQSPVLDVADRVVDGVPNSVKSLAIDWFGTNDKRALLIGIASILTVYAAVIGVLALGRRWKAAVVGIAGFGIVGAYASQTTRRAAPFVAVVPSIVGAGVAVLALWYLRRSALGERPNDRPGDRVELQDRSSIAELVPNDRRRFIATLGLGAAGAVVLGASGRKLATRTSASTSRASLTLPVAAQPLPPAGPGIAAGVPGAAPFFTANRDFYRIDTAITVPQVPVDGWKLRVDGMVDTPLELTFDQLTRRELVEADITLTCVSNEVGGRLMGTARWLGVRLADLLDEAGIAPDADQIVGRSVDGYTCGFPTAALDGRDALIAIGMNGELLPVAHGFPARLIVPGLYGYVSATKWLKQIEVTRFDRFDQYWVKRGWVDDAPIKLQSRIETPRGLSTVDAGVVAIAGSAWAQTRGIERVEVKVDDGEWLEATLADELNESTWRQWTYPWSATPGRHTVTVRATEKNGPIQTPERSEPFPSGATGQHQIVVLVR
jgi:DMSO/TMAO reductase YedYZ molybdopterin-dependent catalytic subunit